MDFWIKYLFITYSITSLSECYHYTGTVKTLRKSMEQLSAGKLKFSDKYLPSYEEEFEDITPENQAEYDFVIVGAGSAGTTIASRLSEVKNITVLLIEAGPKEYPIMDIPAMAIALQLSNSVKWDYHTESSDKYCLGMENSQCRLPRGKAMGGSSSTNAMMATRCNKKDYDDWAEVTGDKSWSYEEMLQYLKKLENFGVEGVPIDEKLHNKNGPVHITFVPYRSNMSKVFMEAGRELGSPFVDYNGKYQIGFSYIQHTIFKGERWSTNRAYIHPIKGRNNLFVTKDSHVNKILIDKSTKLAYGVEFMKDGKTIEVKARKEVILSAGAINSPQILMLSGIGPTSHLKELGIDIVKDAPVGENLMDHIAYGGLIFTTNQPVIDSSIFNNHVLSNYINDGSGPLSSTGFENFGYINTDTPNPFNGNPNIEIIFANVGGIKNPLFAVAVGMAKKNIIKVVKDILKNSTFTMWPMILKPRSRGRILLRSKNPKDKPKIYTNYLDDPDDVRVLIKGIRFVLRIIKTEAFSKYDPKLYPIPLPHCKKYDYDSDSFWECALRTYPLTIYHQAGTCKMGRENDPTAVLNSKLQVIGIKSLRVIDASFMPYIVSAHPNIPIIAASEKMADVIKKEWNYI